MPWKPTKLKFCGIAVRRRTLYVLTLFFAIAAVPALSWALLARDNNVPQAEQIGYLAGATVVAFLAFCGWFAIVRHHSILYRHEARIIWPGAAVLLALATWLGCQFAQSSFQHSKHEYLTPLVLGGMFMAFLLVRCFMIGRHPKREDIVRGGHSRRGSRPPTPTGAAVAASEPPAQDEDELDGDLAEDEAAPTDSPK